jgi:hypothetical protein
LPLQKVCFKKKFKKINISINIFIGWMKSHRPSIRDISIIDEEEERDNYFDDENPRRRATSQTQPTTLSAHL